MNAVRCELSANMEYSMYMFFVVIALYDIIRTFVINIITNDRQDLMYEIMQQNATILNHLTKRAPIYLYDNETDAFLKEEATKHYGKHIEVAAPDEDEQEDEEDMEECESDTEHHEHPPNELASSDEKKEQ
jgi:hypothetical protein